MKAAGVVAKISLEDCVREAATLAATFREQGALILPGLFADDEVFQELQSDLSYVVETLLATEPSAKVPASASFDDRVTALAAANRKKAGLLYDLGTRPAKLVSASRLRVHPAILTLVRAIFGHGALLAGPALGDTFHVFPPGEENYRFNLPIHQDYPYLMQSPSMLTLWLNFGRPHEGIGGITLWPGSHKLGLMPQRRTNGHLEIVATREQMDAFEPVDFVAGVGDAVLMDGLLWHRSNRNVTPDRTRIVQLFRYTDLTQPTAVEHKWASTEAGGRGLSVEQAYPELVRSE